MYEEAMGENYEATKRKMTDHYYERKGKIWAEAEAKAKEETKKYNESMDELDRAFNITMEAYRKAVSS